MPDDTKAKARPKLTPEQRKLRGRVAANKRWSDYYAQRLSATAHEHARAKALFDLAREED